MRNNILKRGLALLALLLTACGTLEDFKTLNQNGPTVYLKADIQFLTTAAATALSENRLGIIESTPSQDGLQIYAEQPIASGIVMNSYGGYAKITIAAAPHVGPGVYAVSAITRSKAINEPVAKTDILKGFNYNDPIVATKILDKIQRLVDETARN